MQNQVLFVQHDLREAPAVSAAIAHVTLVRPAHVASGEAAVAWVQQHPCDLCVVDFQLPGITGIETMLRIRHRLPNVPVIIISGAKTEDAAITAFRAGASDYVPKRAGATQVLGQSIQRLLARREATTSPHLPPPPPSVNQQLPAELIRPTYQNRLRAIGRQLDLADNRSIVLVEVGGGFVVRASPQGLRSHVTLEFPDDQLPHLISTTLSARGQGEHRRPTNQLLPTGYEAFLRAVGYELDRHNAEAISLAELTTFVTIGALAQEEGFEHSALSPAEWLLQAEDIELLLNNAYGRRSSRESEQKGSRLSRLWRGDSGGDAC